MKTINTVANTCRLAADELEYEGYSTVALVLKESADEIDRMQEQLNGRESTWQDISKLNDYVWNSRSDILITNQCNGVELVRRGDGYRIHNNAYEIRLSAWSHFMIIPDTLLISQTTSEKG